MPLLIRKVIDADGVEWVVRRLVRESARLNGSDPGGGRKVSVLRCYAAGRKVEVCTDRDWEELSDAALLALISRANGDGCLDRG